jgi:FkbM family methyltransferase
MPLIPTLRFIVGHPLNRDRKGHALLDFLKWQVGSRLVPGPVLVEWVLGTRVIVRPGDTGMTQNLYCGLHEFEDMAYLLHLMTPQDLFVDVGANVGSYTVLACAGRGARGYSFEPIPSTYRRLVDNLVVNDLLERVKALNIGLSGEDGELNFTSTQGTCNHVTQDLDNRDSCVTVSVRTLDSILHNESPAMLKIDVEGFETPVLEGARATLANPSLHSVLIELNGSGARYGFDDDRIVRKLTDNGFVPYAYAPFTRELHQLRGKNPAGGNTLFLRNLDLIRQRISCAPRLPIRSGSL